MRLISYAGPSGPRAGVLTEDNRILDAERVLGTPVRDVQALLELGHEAVHELRDTPSAAIVEGGARLLAPIARPPTIRDFAAFEGHVANAIRNQGLERPPDWWYRESVFYFSNPLTMLAPEGDVYRPRATRQLDYEVEIAAIIGREGSNIPEAEALDHVAGFALFNDWSAREICAAEFGTFGLHKGKDFAQALGPWVLTTDEVSDRWLDGRLDLKVWGKVNGETWTDSTTRDMHWPMAHLVSYASRDSRLVPGDVIGTGTVTLGCIFERPSELRWLEAGDVVEIGGERLGSTRHTVRVHPPD